MFTPSNLNFLSEGKLRVRVATSLSDFYDQEMGDPQGTILCHPMYRYNQQPHKLYKKWC